MNSPIENALLAAIRSSVPELYTLWDACDEQDQYAFGPQGVRPIDPNHPALHSVDYACDFYGVDPDENEDIDNSFFIWSGVRVATYRVDFMIPADAPLGTDQNLAVAAYINDAGDLLFGNQVLLPGVVEAAAP